ncbi:hypothetical protein DVK85_01365 [Flavobacterium arcticum]|uniref:Uncharacterized protein n=1 Tax=Flavobacterium arcticum TaxID=1784713 RepID=A0A345H8P1_9FLAO|nr:hypothetical protein [Flavobacterium arcticum]AXG72951.1 hypothetical protein DVK85_01365 [Flavobacterium arcticum]KAF2510385.1 hypothetical protein E0W72_07840 [Flavobacterium arcticum]
MKTHADKKSETKLQSVANTISKNQSSASSPMHFEDNRPGVIVQKKLLNVINNHSNQQQPIQKKNTLPNSTNTKVVQRAIINIDGYEGAPLDTDQEGMTAIKSYIKKLVDEHNTGGYSNLVEKLNQLGEDDSMKVPELLEYRNAYMHQLSKPLSQDDDATKMSDALETPIGQGTQHQIPQTIHRFWSGGSLSESAMKTLIDSAKKTEGTPWKHKLWYSKKFEDKIKKAEPSFFERFGQKGTDYKNDQAKIKAREDQRAELKAKGYDIKAIEDLADGEHGVTTKELDLSTDIAATSAKKGGEGAWDNLKYFSDIARLMYLHSEGGHHMDVDIGLGDMDMHKQYSHNDPNGEVPLMGTLARDMTPAGGGQEVSEKLKRTTEHQVNPYKPEEAKQQYLTDVKDLADKATTGSAMYNALIASRPKTNHIKAAIDKTMETLRPKKEDQNPEFSSGMGASYEMLTGGRTPEHTQKLNTGMKQSVPPYLLRLEHLTPESEN